MTITTPDVKIYMPSPVVVGAQKLATSIYEAYSVDHGKQKYDIAVGSRYRRRKTYVPKRLPLDVEYLFLPPRRNLGRLPQGYRRNNNEFDRSGRD